MITVTEVCKNDRVFIFTAEKDPSFPDLMLNNNLN